MNTFIRCSRTTARCIGTRGLDGVAGSATIDGNLADTMTAQSVNGGLAETIVTGTFETPVDPVHPRPRADRCAFDRARGVRNPVPRGAQRQFASAFPIGSSRTRRPVAAKIALPSAGIAVGLPISPAPAGRSRLGTITTSTSGASAIRGSG